MAEAPGIAEVNEAGRVSVRDLDAVVSLWNQLQSDPQISVSLLNRLQQTPQVGSSISDVAGDSRSKSREASSYNTVQRFLEEGRNLKCKKSELTETLLLENYERQRRWFQGLIAVSAILGFLILLLQGFMLYFDLRHRSNELPSIAGIQGLYLHSICMTLAVIIGFPLAVLPYRCCPNTRFWTLNYVHTGLYCGVTLIFMVGLFIMVIRHGQFPVTHFATFHSWMGALLTVGLVVEIISGIQFFRRKYRKDVRKETDLKVQFHTVLGECLLVTGLVTWVTGISHAHDFNTANWWNGIAWNIIGLLSFALTLISFVLIFHPIFRRRSRPVVEYIFTNPNRTQGSSKTIVSKHELLSGVNNKLRMPMKVKGQE